jgi:poly(glycerol-phosphate) alpha-glucosyltransferase
MDGGNTLIRTGAILRSLSPKTGGFFQSVRRLSQTLHQEAVGVEVFGLRDEWTDDALSAWHPIQARVFSPRGPRSYGFAPGLTQSLVAGEFDLLHRHGLWMYPSLACVRWHRQTKRPYVISPRGMLDPWAVRHSHWKKSLVGVLHENGFLRGASCLHALCQAEANSIRQYGLRNLVCLIPNGIDLPEHSPNVFPPWQAASEAGCKVLLYLGRIHHKKNLLNLINAWAKIRKGGGARVKEWILAIAGYDQASHENELKVQCAALGVESSVRFPGPQFNEDKAACYYHCAAFILPSFSEGMPMVVLEAWSYGKPVLMTPECNLPEGFAAGAAIHIETKPEGIAEGLRQLIEMSDADRQAMGQRGLQLVSERFTWAKIASEMRVVYEWILGRGSKPSCVITD